MQTTKNHNLLKLLANFPQFQSKLLDGGVVDLRSGAFVWKYDGGDEPKHRNSLAIRWPGQPFDISTVVDGEKYAKLQIREAVLLGENADSLQKLLEDALI